MVNIILQTNTNRLQSNHTDKPPDAISPVDLMQLQKYYANTYTQYPFIKIIVEAPELSEIQMPLTINQQQSLGGGGGAGCEKFATSLHKPHLHVNHLCLRSIKLSTQFCCKETPASANLSSGSLVLALLAVNYVIWTLIYAR